MIEWTPDPPRPLRELEPRFRAGLRRLRARSIPADATGAASDPVAAELDRLAGPIFRLAADLVVGRLCDEAQALLDLELDRRPDWDFTTLQRGLDALRPDPATD